MLAPSVLSIDASAPAAGKPASAAACRLDQPAPGLDSHRHLRRGYVARDPGGAATDPGLVRGVEPPLRVPGHRPEPPAPAERDRFRDPRPAARLLRRRQGGHLQLGPLCKPGPLPRDCVAGRPGHGRGAAHNVCWINFPQLAPGDEIDFETRYVIFKSPVT